MNHIYKTVWNEALGAWVAVSELSKSRGKRALARASVITISCLSLANVQASSGNLACTESFDAVSDTLTATCNANGNSFRHWIIGNKNNGSNYRHQVVTLDDTKISALYDSTSYIDGVVKTQYYYPATQDTGSVTINATDFKQLKAVAGNYKAYGIKLQIGGLGLLQTRVDGTVNIDGTSDSTIDVTNKSGRAHGVLINGSAESISTINMSNPNATIDVKAKGHAQGLTAISNHERYKRPITDYDSRAIIDMTAGSINVSANGKYAIGLLGGIGTDYGSTDITESGGSITATAPLGYAIGIRAKAGDKLGTATVNQSGGSITALGKNSAGIIATAGGDISIEQNSGSIIFALGKDTSKGISANSTAGNINATINGIITTGDIGIESKTQSDTSRSNLGMSTITIGDDAHVTAATALQNDDGDSETTIGKATITGTLSHPKADIILGDGSDNLTFNGTVLTNIGEINGGIDTDVTNEFDTLTFAAYSNSNVPNIAGEKLQNWERIELDTDFILSGDTLSVGTGSSSAGIDGGLVVNSGKMLTIDTQSPTSPGNHPFALDGDLHNGSGSTVNLRRGGADEFTTLTVDGDYHGGGTMLFNTELGDDTSPTDKLVLNGSATGSTTVVVQNKGGTGALTNNGIELIDIANPAANVLATAFTMPDSVEIGSYEYNTLEYKASDGFYLKSKRKSTGGGSGTGGTTDSADTPNPTPSPVPTPTPNPDTPHQPEVYRPAVPGYVMAQQVNMATTSSMLGNHLHQRMGEQQISMLDQHNNQAWGRLRTESLSLQGKKQFDLDQDTQILQFGWDLDVNRDNQSGRQHTGVYIGYANSNADFSDRKRTLDNQPIHTGDLDSNVLAAGAYHTRFDAQGNYIDLIGGVHYVNNDYRDIYSGKSDNDGWGISASAEAGWHHDLGNGYFVEPQAQLTAQTTKYSDFNDEVTHIDGYSSNSLRPRLGVRAGFADIASGQDIYATASLVHELLSPAEVRIGGTDVKEDIGKDTWLEVGIGGQLPLNNNTVIYGSAQYLHTLGNNSRRGGSGQVGLRYSW